MMLEIKGVWLASRRKWVVTGKTMCTQTYNQFLNSNNLYRTGLINIFNAEKSATDFKANKRPAASGME
jgi:hypothetical protein